jgi:DnaJ family protein C protein 28
MDWIAEERIKTAMESGAFDNLPGKGKPLRLDENPHEPEDWRIAFHVLRNSGVRLPWIERSRAIDQELENARREAALAYQHAVGSSTWQHYADRFRARIAVLNRQIFLYNLQTPSMRFQRLLIDPSAELAVIEGGQTAPRNSP